MSPLEICAVIISIIGVSLTTLRNMWCWFFNFFAYLLYAYLFYEYQLFGEVALQVIFLFMNQYGFYYWLKTKKIEHDIKIVPLAKQTAIKQLGLAFGLGVLFGLILKYLTPASVPLLDAQLAAFSLLATYWTAQKHIATWMLWIVIDIVYVGMFSYKTLYLTAGLYAAFVLLACYGWWCWYCVQQKQSPFNYKT